MTSNSEQEQYQDLFEQAFSRCPDSWDSDMSQEYILVTYIHHLEDLTEKRGDCLHSWCRWEDGDACDHGYLDNAIAEPALRQVLRKLGEVAKIIEDEGTIT